MMEIESMYQLFNVILKMLNKAPYAYCSKNW